MSTTTATDTLPQLDSRYYKQVPRKDLMQDALADPLVTGNKDLPVFVRVGDLGLSGTRAPATKGDLGGREFIEIDERYHKWTPQYVKERILSSDSDIERKTSYSPQEFSAYLESRIDRFPDGVGEARVRRFKELADLAQAPVPGVGDVTLNILPPRNSGNLYSATVSKEGNHHVLIREDVLMRAIMSDKETGELKAWVGHERKHIAARDFTPERAAHIHNLKLGKSNELFTDLGSHDHQGLAQSLRGMLVSEIGSYNKATGNKIDPNAPTAEQLKAVSDWESKRDPAHPSLFTRLSTTEIGASLTFWHKNKYPGAPEEEREKWVASRILEQIKRDELPAPASLNPPAGLTADALKDIGGMKSLPMQETQKPGAASAPAGARGPREKN